METGNARRVTSDGGRRGTALRRLLRGALAVGLVVALSQVWSVRAPRPATATAPVVVAFQTMLGDSGPYVGGTNPIRGIPGGGAPWEITSGVGRLTSNGQLVISVHGLTLLNGTNPVPFFDGAVSCQSEDAHGNAIVANVFTSDFPASPQGNSMISATLTLPTPCFAPLIFVTSPAPQAWFAVMGH